MKKCPLILLAAAVFVAAKQVNGHGMIVDPPGRSSMWRVYPDQPINWNDNGLNCGGITAQHDASTNAGRCGECGDEWVLPRPRENDEGGIYWTGKIGQTYHEGNMARLTVNITANHKGYFEFRLCPKESASQLVTQECLDRHLLTLQDGTTKYFIGTESKLYYPVVQLPDGVTCENCVLQWWWTAGNNVGFCEDGTEAEGCGNQETFVNCADIAITPKV